MRSNITQPDMQLLVVSTKDVRLLKELRPGDLAIVLHAVEDRRPHASELLKFLTSARCACRLRYRLKRCGHFDHGDYLGPVGDSRLGCALGSIGHRRRLRLRLRASGGGL